MNDSEFLTESQTLAYAGIDRNILTRFCETGYIKTKLLANGQVLYSKAEIERIFGKRREALSNQVGNSDVSNYTAPDQFYSNESNQNSFSRNTSENDVKPQHQNVSRLIKFPESAKTSISELFSDLPNFDSPSQKTSSKNEQIPREGNREDFKETASMRQDRQSQFSDINNNDAIKNENFLNEKNNVVPNNIKQQNIVADHNMATNMQTSSEKVSSAAQVVNASNSEKVLTFDDSNLKKLAQENENLKQEIVKLQSYARLQKKLLEVKEKEIGELKQEKDWLKNRIETQEEKNNRDQLLILSETRVIHNLISNGQKASPFRAALEWLGFAKKDRQETIDMGK